MTIPSQSKIDYIRAVFKDTLVAPYRLMLQQRTLEALDKLTEDADFAGATDPSALSFLALYVRIRQPDLVLQLGTYVGFSTLVLADVIANNPTPGRFVTVEPVEEKNTKARQFVQRAGLESWVDFLVGKSTDVSILEQLRKRGPFDMIYVDSSHSYRGTLDELKLYCHDDSLSTCATLFCFHDIGELAKQWDPTAQGGVRRALREWMAKKTDEFQILALEPPIWPNACGLGIMSHRRFFYESSSPDDRAATAGTTNQQAARIAELEQEVQSLREHLIQVQRGRVMRFLNWLHQQKTRLRGNER